MTDTNMLKTLISESGLKKTHIAKQLNLTRNGLMKKVDGISDFKANEIVNLCKILNIEVEMREKIFFTCEVINNHPEQAQPPGHEGWSE